MSELYRGEKRQRGGKKKRKKNKEETHVPQNWDDIYDPSRPNSHEDYKHSDEKTMELREWKDKLYAHRIARRQSSDSRSDSDNGYRPQVQSTLSSDFGSPILTLCQSISHLLACPSLLQPILKMIPRRYEALHGRVYQMTQPVKMPMPDVCVFLRLATKTLVSLLKPRLNHRRLQLWILPIVSNHRHHPRHPQRPHHDLLLASQKRRSGTTYHQHPPKYQHQKPISRTLYRQSKQMIRFPQTQPLGPCGPVKKVSQSASCPSMAGVRALGLAPADLG